MAPGRRLPRQPPQPPPKRPLVVELAGLGLIAGGLVGISQVFLGTYVVTGSLPATAPILGVALIAYLVTVALGLAVRTGRGWLGALNVALLTALLYLPAAERPLIAALAVAHTLVAGALLASRSWFAAIRDWRRGGTTLHPR
jgi:hypothetical protein